MSFEAQLEQYAERKWQERRPTLHKLSEKAAKLFQECEETEKIYLKYILATLPLSDLSEYDFSVFQEAVASALKAKEEFPWCKEMPPELFLLHVVYPRVNNEELESCRQLFQERLAERVRSLSLEQAIFEVNCWCAEQATYRSTDDRTASAKKVYECGYGRCGEESAFAVNAFRSVGICARQVYAPRWSHCDDNHAWVEVYDGKRWRYLGACEPEPELDRGWFTGAASRAMLIHTKYFLPGTPEETAFLLPEDGGEFCRREGMVYELLTGRYGKTRRVTVSVADEAGKPAGNAEVAWSVINYAGPERIAVTRTGKDGKARIGLGEGSILVSAFSDGKYAECLADTRVGNEIFLTLREERPEEPCRSEDVFYSPEGMSEFPAPLSLEQKKLRKGQLDRAAVCREERQSQRSGDTVVSGRELAVLNTLPEKDLRDKVPAAVLEDCLDAWKWEKSFPREVWERVVLCPRIGLEPLRPWRKLLQNAFSPEEEERYREDPRKLWDWVGSEIKLTDSFHELPASPAATLCLRAGNETSRDILFCAICRALGIPARIRNGEPEFWLGNTFLPVRGKERSCLLELAVPEAEEAVCHRNFSLTKLENGRYLGINAGTISAGKRQSLALAPGRYSLFTVSRLPRGDQLMSRLDFMLHPGERKEIRLSFRKGTPKEMLCFHALPPFTLWNEKGGEISSNKLFDRFPATLLIWLEAGREPTEHILNELREVSGSLSGRDCGIAFVLEDGDRRGDPTLNRALSELPDAEVFLGDFTDASLLARRMYTDPEKLPLLILTDRKGNGLYTMSGYNVGTGPLLIQLLEAVGDL